MSGRTVLEEIDTAAFRDRFGKSMPAQLKAPRAAGAGSTERP